MKNIAVIATDGFEQSELVQPVKALKDAGHKVSIIGLKPGHIKGWDNNKWGKQIKVDATVADAKASAFDALVLPGGVMSPDKVRIDKHALAFIRSMNKSGKTIAAICHGPWALINAGVAEGRKLTSYKSIKTDLVNAGATWTDKQVVIDGNLITSRNPDDIPAFNKAILKSLQ